MTIVVVLTTLAVTFGAMADGNHRVLVVRDDDVTVGDLVVGVADVVVGVGGLVVAVHNPHATGSSAQILARADGRYEGPTPPSRGLRLE